METAAYHSQLASAVLIPNRFDSKQQKPATNTYPTDVPPEVPPSPTLTNPDMILPDDGERQSSTPSPPFQLNSHIQSYVGSGYHPSNGSNYRAPRSRWTYENTHVHGRPLSDIGEEDLQPPPVFRNTHHEKSDLESNDSGSTISASSQQRLDSNTGEHGGSDSRRSSYASQGSIERARAQASEALAGSSKPAREEGSSAILSTEAERILENAKRRLTLMEGNLSRARTSIRSGQTPSPSPSLPGHLLPTRNLQPAGELYRSISQTDRRASLLRPRPVYTNTQDVGHSRGHSETNLPSSAPSLSSPTLQPSRSMSALASSNTLRNDSREGPFQYDGVGGNGNIQLTPEPIQSPRDLPQEDDYYGTSHHTPEVNDSAEELGAPSPKTKTKTMPKMSSIEDFNAVYPPEGPPSRAQSQLQVRDLKDQAAGLRNKVALLKVKTQEDNIRRRSLQSLRTLSPFTAAEQWYSSALENGSESNHRHSNAGYGWVADAIARPDSDGQGLTNGANQFAMEEMEEGSLPIDEGFALENDEQSILDSQYEDAEEGEDEFYDDEIDREELNQILDESFDDDDNYDGGNVEIVEDFIPDAAPEATPHEEREDAFDYENFYLHSALGTFSRSKIRRRSVGSAGSADTTRPSRHNRTGSGDSVSTFATFATATENAYDDALQAIDQIVDNWDDFDDEDDGLTPVQSRRATVIDRSSNNGPPHYLATNIQDNNNNSNPLTPTTPLSSTAAARGIGRDVTTPTTPVDAFMSSLSRSVSTRPPSSLQADDTRLLEQVFESLGKVCAELQELTIDVAGDDNNNSNTAAAAGANGENTDTPPMPIDPKYIRKLRRRLDAARRVLDGQLDSDT